MKYFFSLQIFADSCLVNDITRILEIEPNLPQVNWGYELKIEEHSYTNFIERFLGILDGKYEQLEKIGISRSDITIWMIYEYDEQCNMEFFPDEMRRLGENGISLCVSCYHNGR